MRLRALYLGAGQEQRLGRQGLRAGAELRLRAMLQERKKLPERQGLKAGSE